MYENKLYQKTLKIVETSRESGMLTAHGVTRHMIPLIKDVCKQFSVYYATRKSFEFKETKEEAFNNFTKQIL